MGFGKFKFVLWAHKEYDYSHLRLFLKSMYNKYGWSYLFCGDEICPKTGTQHIDGYYEMPTARKVKTEINKFNKVFGKGFGQVVIANGSAGENCDYSEKEGRETLLIGEPAKQGERCDLKEAIALVTTGSKSVDDFCLDNPMLFHQYGRTLSRAEDILLRRRFRTEMTEGIWYFGPTASGKSHIAFEGFDPKTHYLYKLNEQWQDGYTGQEIVIINDLRDEIKYNHMLQLVDKWPFTVPRRGREPAPFLAKKVIVTCPMTPTDCYPRQDNDSIDQLLRRFKVVELSQRANITL